MESRKKTIRGIILAGTYNWGDSVFERLLPRPLLPVAQRPLISYGLQWLSDGGINEVTVCANSGLRAVRMRFMAEPPPGMQVDYYEDRLPRGPAGCLRDAALFCDADAFVVTDGTAIPVLPLDALLASHLDSGAAVTVVVHEEEVRRNGASLTSPSGIYVFDRRVLPLIPAKGYHDVKERLIPALYRAGEKVVTYTAPGASARVLDAKSYVAVNHWMVERLADLPKAPEGFITFGDVLAHASARIALDTRFVGPALIGPDVKIEEGATVIGPVSIGAGCQIGTSALVSRSVLWTGCQVGDRATVDRCILADGVTVEAGRQLFSEVVVPKPTAGALGKAPRPSAASAELLPPTYARPLNL